MQILKAQVNTYLFELMVMENFKYVFAWTDGDGKLSSYQNGSAAKPGNLIFDRNSKVSMNYQYGNLITFRFQNLINESMKSKEQDNDPFP